MKCQEKTLFRLDLLSNNGEYNPGNQYLKRKCKESKMFRSVLLSSKEEVNAVKRAPQGSLFSNDSNL